MSEKAANDYQIGGEHYTGAAIQPWDFIIAHGLNFLEGCIVKYIVRYRKKGGRQDLLKARQYLDKLIEITPE